MADIDDAPTCGKGLAEHSVLPAKLGELIAALADNLEIHQSTLDLGDERSRRELDAYAKLTREHRKIAEQLHDVARHMASYRDLPMGRHDEHAMTDPRGVQAFESFVRVERELLVQLRDAVERDETMLAAARGHASR